MLANNNKGTARRGISMQARITRAERARLAIIARKRGVSLAMMASLAGFREWLAVPSSPRQSKSGQGSDPCPLAAGLIRVILARFSGVRLNAKALRILTLPAPEADYRPGVAWQVVWTHPTRLLSSDPFQQHFALLRSRQGSDPRAQASCVRGPLRAFLRVRRI